MPNVQAGRARAPRTPLIVAPHGMLTPVALSFSAIQKKLFWHLLQKASIKAATCIQATSVQEYNELRAFGLGNPVAIIPNGIDIPEPAPPPGQQRKDPDCPFARAIHPKKGLDRLVRAWAKVELERPNGYCASLDRQN